VCAKISLTIATFGENSAVVGAEIATRQDRRPKGGEKTGTDPREPRLAIRGVCADTEAPHAASNEEVCSGGSGLHLWCGVHFGEQLAQHRLIVTLSAHLEVHLQDALCAEARVHCDEPTEARDKQKCAGDQHQRYRDLDDDQQALKTRTGYGPR